MLLDGIIDIEEDQRIVLVGLILLDCRRVLLRRKVFAVGIFPQHERRGFLGEFLVGQDAVLDKDFQIVPLLLILGTHRRKEFVQPLGDLAGDVARNLLHVGIALQITARYVQRNVGRIDNAVQQCQILRHDTFYLVGYEDLIAIQLYLVLLNLEIVVDFREIEDTRQMERIVDVQMDVEQRLVAHRIEFAIEILVLLLGNVGRLACPQRLGRVDLVVFVGIDILAILPLLDLAEHYGNRQEMAILFE